MKIHLLAYAVACVVVPVAWGLMVSWLLSRFPASFAKPNVEEATSSIDLHERS